MKCPPIAYRRTAICALLLSSCISAQNADARSFRMDGTGCLYELQYAARPIRTLIAFSFLPLSVKGYSGTSQRIASSHDASTFEAVHESGDATAPAVPGNAPESASPDDQWFNSWRIFESLGPWQFNAATGFTHPLVNRGSSVAVGYSDIFETGCNPEKGGHGLSFLFRHDFGK